MDVTIGAVKEDLVGVETVLGAPSPGISRAIRAAVSAVDGVHNVRRLAFTVPVVGDAAMLEGGKYRWDMVTGKPIDIRLNPRGDHPELTAVLEIGHLLDHQAIGVAGEFASIAHPRLAGWRKAVDSTRVVRRLEDLRDAGSIPYHFADGVVRQVKVERIAGYMLEQPELFSRSYAQFISTSSGDVRIRSQIEGFLRPENPSSVVPCFWEEGDFDHVSKALESLIIGLGWKK